MPGQVANASSAGLEHLDALASFDREYGDEQKESIIVITGNSRKATRSRPPSREHFVSSDGCGMRSDQEAGTERILPEDTVWLGVNLDLDPTQLLATRGFDPEEPLIL